MSLCVCVHACGGLKLTRGLFLSYCLPYLLRKGFSVKSRVHQSAGLFIQPVLGNRYLYLWSSGIAGDNTPAWLSFGFWRPKLWFSCLPTKCFSHQSLSSFPFPCSKFPSTHPLTHGTVQNDIEGRLCMLSFGGRFLVWLRVTAFSFPWKQPPALLSTEVASLSMASLSV